MKAIANAQIYGFNCLQKSSNMTTFFLVAHQTQAICNVILFTDLVDQLNDLIIRSYTLGSQCSETRTFGIRLRFSYSCCNYYCHNITSIS